MVKSQLVAASSVPIVLSILAEGPSHGYAILQRVRALSGGELEFGEGMLYPVLHRLERRGWIRSEWGRSEQGRRRRVYAIEPPGRRALERERREWRVVHGALQRLWEGLPCPG